MHTRQTSVGIRNDIGHKVRGFTLIELMIVVAIVGILAALAVPNFLKMSCRAEQSEAKTNGRTMLRMVDSHIEEFNFNPNGTARAPGLLLLIPCPGAGATSGDFAGFAVKGEVRRYSYRLFKQTPTQYQVRATGCSGMVIADMWQGVGTVGMAGTIAQFDNIANSCR